MNKFVLACREISVFFIIDWPDLNWTEIRVGHAGPSAGIESWRSPQKAASASGANYNALDVGTSWNYGDSFVRKLSGLGAISAIGGLGFALLLVINSTAGHAAVVTFNLASDSATSQIQMAFGRMYMVGATYIITCAAIPIL